jgi:hypothetical protein
VSPVGHRAFDVLAVVFETCGYDQSALPMRVSRHRLTSIRDEIQ